MKPLRVALADDEPLARARLARLLREARAASPCGPGKIPGSPWPTGIFLMKCAPASPISSAITPMVYVRLRRSDRAKKFGR